VQHPSKVQVAGSSPAGRATFKGNQMKIERITPITQPDIVLTLTQNEYNNLVAAWTISSESNRKKASPVPLTHPGQEFYSKLWKEVR
jgi:hypothetical protein